MSESAQAPAPVGFVLCDDMLFTSRVTATARDLGLAVKPARSTEALHKLIQQQNPRCVIVDLANPGLDIGELVRCLKSISPTPRVIAYGSHVDTATLRLAREAGCDSVLPRSKFVEELPSALTRWMT